MKRLRVAHLTPTYFDDSSYIGGGERYVSNLVQSLQLHCADTVDARIISFSVQSAPDRGAETLIRDGIETTLLPNLYRRGNPMEAGNPLLWQMLSEFDVVHIHQPFSTFGSIATTIAKHLGLPVVASDLGGGGSPVILQRNTINLADALVCISEYSASLLRPTVKAPIYVLIGPVDTRVFRPSDEPLARLPQVSCVGRILPHKGIDRVIRALPYDLPLVVCGRVYHERYYELLKELSVGKTVRFLTDASDTDIIDLYRTSAVNVLASTYQDVFGQVYPNPELMGLTVIEAMACGTPTFVSRVASLPELVIPEETGRIFNDETQLATFFADVRDGIYPLKGSDNRCTAHVENSFSMGAVANGLLQVYQAVLAAKSQVVA
ncbi:MAG: glycosyltransferase [Cyanobacteria bacterium J069]